MKKTFSLLILATFATLLTASFALAGDAEKHHEMKIMIKADDATMIDADVSDLAVGESQSFVSESGKIVDVLRTTDGIELYIDGELQDLGFGDGAIHGAHVVKHANVEVECISDDESECDHDFIFISEDGDIEFDHDGAGDVKIIEKRVEIICDENEECDEMVWISADGEELHEAGEGHKVIRIHKNTEDSD